MDSYTMDFIRAGTYEIYGYIYHCVIELSKSLNIATRKVFMTLSG